MPKLFVVSDIHGFYDEFREALDQAGFDPENENYYLVTCGDHWDRGNKPNEVMSYLMGLKRWIGIKGNHEQLFEDCCKRKYWYSYDISNGTFDSIGDVGSAGPWDTFDECCEVAWKKAKPFFNKMVDYLETKNYIFVHGWLPENFREATKKQWDDATWLCGPKMALDGYNNTGKTVVFGHWHTSYLWAIKEGWSEFGDDAKFDIFCGNDFIAIDACTAHTHKVNVLVLEDEFIGGK